MQPGRKVLIRGATSALGQAAIKLRVDAGVREWRVFVSSVRMLTSELGRWMATDIGVAAARGFGMDLAPDTMSVSVNGMVEKVSATE